MFPNVISLACKRTVLSASVRRYATDISDANRLEKTLNHVHVLGRVGSEPQKRGTAVHPVVIFSLATHMNYKYNSGEFMQKTDWHRICVFKPILRDTVFKYLKKGQRVMVEGRITYGEYLDEDGQKKPSAAIIADEVIFFPS